jgi:hypothetical protein
VDGAGTDPAPTTVGQLAERLAVSEREAVALCVASGIPVRDARSVLTPEQAAHVDDVLAGRAPLTPPRRRRSLPFNPVRAVIVVCVLVVLTAGVVGVVQFRNRDVRITVQPGDCFDHPGVLGTELHPKPCHEDHDFEAFATVDLLPLFPTFPGDQPMEDFAMNRCAEMARRTDFAMVTYAAFWPKTREAWDSVESRRLVCATPTDTFRGALPVLTP